MTDEVTIAPAGVADAGEILTLQRAAYLVEAQRYGDPFLPPLTETLDEVRAAIAGPTIVLAARLGTRVVGSVRARVDGDTAHVGRLAVAPDLQGRGVGGRLLAAIEAACAGRVARFALFTGAQSAANLGLYDRRGYRVVAHRPDENGNRLAVLEKTPDPTRGQPGDAPA
ncbi:MULTISPECIES: GNAT family N-acetyltransferase [Micromonospora]|uniref:GNAT family N-acetyltransferase n=1 Tax=Micromonospora solifontis TaxID=2487138 RepID=A0ABX9WM74_9ACTN|nr:MULTISPECIES: GNAT family N-acetyltransferase [Micromonospora]NES12947.1 GNAT family N-acetyltransferase [Micromonospora sp. PPF5-17B]NES34735.1 GNAT family N-acetyltransferase [Micromonospora solifontis]NES54872.1 GNAT family N-acetyltransferase [Micromonospora sp. PPF5-6]RNM01639.1 GNAT family N-acetyltransferase [Micromonospora solifontis]